MLVLIVEDELPARIAITRLVQAERHDVIATGSAEEAIHAIDNAAMVKRAIRVALIDWSLGGPITGIEVAKYLRMAHPGASAILISGHSRQEMRDSWRDPIAGFTAFLEKPFDADILTRFLRLAANGDK